MADKTQNVKTRLSFDGEAEYKAACKEINSTLKVLNSEMKLVTAEYKDNASSVDALKAKQAVLQKTYDEQAKKVKETEAALEKCRKATGDNSEESKKLETQLNYQKAALVKTEQELGKTTDEMEKAEKAADEMGKEIKDSGEQADDAKGKFSGFTSVLSGMGTALKAAAAATAAAVAGAATAIGALTTKAIEGYAAQEQLVGGVETLFKTSSDTVVGYANDAYKTAGMSANEYMETVTSFSASLLASMNNDTAAAAEKANVAITDMSDNANKMGTDISLIQNAYNGFAKQNYTMLDNLKLGYGGTKEEMQRLLDDASKLSGIKYDISSYSDVVDAIHVVQTEMGITGTTAKEASTTIEGSVSSMSSAWDNWVAGMADSEANFSQLTSNLVDSIVSNGIVPRSVWTLGHRPKCSPEGMVYLGGGTWVDIYLNSDDGAKGLKSEYGCAPMTGTESMNWYNFVERLAKSGKRLPNYAEFCAYAFGSPAGLDNANTNAWSATSNTGRGVTGSVVNAVSSVGVVDAVGRVWEWLDELITRAEHATNADYHASVAWGWDKKSPLNTGEKSYDVGNIYQYYAYSLAALIAGGYWSTGASCGARAVHCDIYPWNVNTIIGARGACDSL